MKLRTIVFVLGVGRSGSSAMTGLLSLCGATLPAPLLGANAGNPKGHFEPVEALSLNDAFLAQSDSTFYDPSLRLQNKMVLDELDGEQFVARIMALIETWPDEEVLIVKDPRITAVAPYWFEAARRKQYSVKAVIMVRHPEEVAASFAARDQLSRSLSASLWLKYNLLAERVSRALPRVFVDYATLLGDWRTEVTRISEALSIALLPSDEDAIDGFLSLDLHRQKYTHLSGPQDPWTSEIFDFFSRASRGEQLDIRKIERIFSEFAVCEAMFRESWTQFRERSPPELLFSPGTWNDSPYRAHPDVPKDFDAEVYLRIHRDVASAKTDPYRHFVEFGKKENRIWKMET